MERGIKNDMETKQIYNKLFRKQEKQEDKKREQEYFKRLKEDNKNGWVFIEVIENLE